MNYLIGAEQVLQTVYTISIIIYRYGCLCLNSLFNS